MESFVNLTCSRTSARSALSTEAIWDQKNRKSTNLLSSMQVSSLLIRAIISSGERS
jgi:hypothetical protein